MKISDIPKFWLTCEKSKDRWPRVESLLGEIKWTATKINGEIVTPYTIGIAQAHLQALYHKGPLIILEDDIALFNNVLEYLDVPEDADAIYLGHSNYGLIRGKTSYPGVIAADFDSKYNKIYNMLGIHAILYISERYKENVIECLTNFIQENPAINPDYGCDNSIASRLFRYNVYALKKSWFYQADGHSEEATLIPIDPILRSLI